MTQRTAKQRTAWLMVLPALILLAAVFAFPIARAAWLSLFRENLGTQLQPVWTGLGNYERLVLDGRFWQTLRNTTVFTVIAVSLELVLGMGVALVLNQPLKGRGLIRAIAILPWALPTALIALAWVWIFNDQYGVWNDLLLRLGILRTPVNWLGQPLTAMAAIIAADVWKTTSFVAILLLAGLQAIPDDLYEAHALDGAGGWQSFWQITLPLLRPQIIVAVLFRFAQSFGIFDLVQVMTGGGPAGSTETVALYIYATVMRYLDFGYGAALVVVTFAILVAVVALAFAVLQREETA